VLLEASDDPAASGGHVRTEFVRVIRTTGSENLGGRLRVRQTKLRARCRTDSQDYCQSPHGQPRSAVVDHRIFFSACEMHARSQVFATVLN
jgi:hypothetical protein